MQGDFRGAIESDGEVASTGAIGGVSLECAEGPLPFEGKSRDGAHAEDGLPARHADLTAVGMAAEHEADVLPVGDFEDLRAVAKENSGEGRGGVLKGGLHIVNSEDKGIIDTCEGECVGADLDDLCLIDEKANTLGLEAVGKVQTVVVAEDAIEEL